MSLQRRVDGNWRFRSSNAGSRSGVALRPSLQPAIFYLSRPQVSPLRNRQSSSQVTVWLDFDYWCNDPQAFAIRGATVEVRQSTVTGLHSEQGDWRKELPALSRKYFDEQPQCHNQVGPMRREPPNVNAPTVPKSAVCVSASVRCPSQ